MYGNSSQTKQKPELCVLIFYVGHLKKYRADYSDRGKPRAMRYQRDTTQHMWTS